MADSSWLMAGGIVLVALGSVAMSHQPSAISSQSCPTPRAAQWAATRDTLWPLIAHRDGDDAWAHLETAGLPGSSATWCNPLQGDSEAIRAGRELYGRWCASCHGDHGKGDGLNAEAASPSPYDFTRPEFAGTREPPGPAVLYAILTRGIPVTAMRGFGGELGGWERLALMAYVTQLPGPAAIRSSRAWADSLRARRQADGHR